MKLLSLVLILCFTLVSCTGDNTSTVSNEVLTGILTLETTFGNNEDGDEKYLLAQPYGLVVDDNMNIIIPDESSLKVYDIQGNPKTILGGPGQGPNEFESPHVLGEISISPNSNVVAKAGFRSNYNIYDKDLVLLKKINHSQGRSYETILDSLNLRRIRLSKMFFWDEKKIMFQFSASPQKTGGKIDNAHVGLLMERDKNAEIIVYDKIPSFANIEGLGMHIPYQGGLLFDILTKNRIVYISTANDKSTENGVHFYKLTIASVNSNATKEISHNYDRVALPDSLPDYYYQARSGYEDQTKKIRIMTEEFLQKDPYYPPLTTILTDQSLVFAFTHKMNEYEEVFTDIFDADTGTHLRSIYFPFVPRVIKNGKAFYLKAGKDIFPSVEVYSIDEKVYAK